MSKEPLVSVIMPVFNSEGTLVRAINSVLHQKHANLELLVIDNNSSDNSKSIAESYID
ncbi:MAG: glycosyltransferase family 2 protein, partial [Flavobacteriales bacterium]